ncbi:transglutaminase-like cysteine peptidase [Undibacter mobilis]|uniref:Transglutaminase n=1 Tax=Undibacter mobilis TaxID=2292256 RepID=A0A371BCQ0_9BRAD|nr:transglutaminase-like cysteine peptidase [Undibacter mobilis]RDV05338.1 transglutaminase [Undibacter mobilis]
MITSGKGCIRIANTVAIAAAALTISFSAGFAGDRVASLGNSAAANRPVFATVGEATRAPIGWIDFCQEYKGECDTKASAPRDIVLTSKAWDDLVKVNNWANQSIKPVTDIEHWGVVERWNYGEDGYGDCEDYVLVKRRMLTQAGWPREALLITVVRDKRGDGHAVLTVKTDRGEFILDNQEAQILPWTQTGYKFVKRQSQADQNAWVSLGEPRNAPATVSAR